MEGEEKNQIGMDGSVRVDKGGKSNPYTPEPLKIKLLIH